jgi:hypothetical protein
MTQPDCRCLTDPMPTIRLPIPCRHGLSASEAGLFVAAGYVEQHRRLAGYVETYWACRVSSVGWPFASGPQPETPVGVTRLTIAAVSSRE